MIPLGHWRIKVTVDQGGNINDSSNGKCLMGQLIVDGRITSKWVCIKTFVQVLT